MSVHRLDYDPLLDSAPVTSRLSIPSTYTTTPGALSAAAPLSALSPLVKPFHYGSVSLGPSSASTNPFSPTDDPASPVVSSLLSGSAGMTLSSFAHHSQANPFGTSFNTHHHHSSPNPSISNVSATVGAAAATQFPRQLQNPETEEITTIFVVGFPDDMGEREFQNMFTFSKGFEAATLKLPTPPPPASDSAAEESAAQASRKQIIGFVKFRSRAYALEAIELLTGKRIDMDKGCALKAEMAKKNLYLKRASHDPLGPTTSFAEYARQNSLPINTADEPFFRSDIFHFSGSADAATSKLSQSGSSDMECTGTGASFESVMAVPKVIPRPQNPSDMNAPKNTLYVGGLPAVLGGPQAAAQLEEALRAQFSRTSGFKRLSFRTKSNGPIVFVEFEDTACATWAMLNLTGSSLGGIVKGGIRLSYSKNPLGVRSFSESTIY